MSLLGERFVMVKYHCLCLNRSSCIGKPLRVATPGMDGLHNHNIFAKNASFPIMMLTPWLLEIMRFKAEVSAEVNTRHF